MPALLTRTSRRPNVSTARVDERLPRRPSSPRRWCRRSRPRRRRRSRPTTSDAGSASAPSPSIDPPRSLTTTLAPRSASRSACARPMPRPAPVTTATRPSKLCSFTPSLMELAPCRVYRPVTILLGSCLAVLYASSRPHRRHHAQPPRGAQRGRSGDGARPRGGGGSPRGRSRRLGRGPVREHRGSGDTPSSVRVPTSRSSRRPAPRRRSTPSGAGSPGSCTASERSRSWSPSTGWRPRAGWRSSSRRTSSSRRHDRRSASRRFGATCRRGRRALPSPAAIGRASAMDAILTGEPIDARRAHRPRTRQPVGRTGRGAGRGARASRSRSSRRLRSRCAASRRVVLSAAYEHDDTLRKVSRELLDELLASDDASEGLPAFAEKRAPQWQGR